MKNFDVEIAEIFEVDSVNMDDPLDSFECWDSLTILSIIALASETYNVTLSADEIIGAVSIGGLKALIQAKLR
ncbi:MAG: acyl carrier protein [Chitinophagaceae bacterium]|nr:acyl carrier protein [Chitinophagaceae bacterium]MCA6511678.1 acyl carrier protein [Chitinophagaceae bacterium]